MPAASSSGSDPEAGMQLLRAAHEGSVVELRELLERGGPEQLNWAEPVRRAVAPSHALPAPPPLHGWIER